MELESHLYHEAFLKEHEKNPSYKQAFDFKTKMFGSLKSQRTSLVPLFRLLDRVVQVKQTVDDTLDMSGAVVTPEGHPEVGPNPGWGEDDVPAIFRPLLSSPEVPLEQEEDKLDLSDIDSLPQQVIEHIKQKAREKAALNREHAYRALNTLDGLCIMPMLTSPMA